MKNTTVRDWNNSLVVKSGSAVNLRWCVTTPSSFAWCRPAIRMGTDGRGNSSQRWEHRIRGWQAQSTETLRTWDWGVLCSHLLGGFPHPCWSDHICSYIFSVCFTVLLFFLRPKFLNISQMLPNIEGNRQFDWAEVDAKCVGLSHEPLGWVGYTEFGIHQGPSEMFSCFLRWRSFIYICFCIFWTFSSFVCFFALK